MICTVLEITSFLKAIEMELSKIYSVFCDGTAEIKLLKNGGKQELN